ncbi:hypothetical protein NQ314_006548 [Rhamnusium bicolor]|uniref:Minichromosome maintenance protein 2 n=1 Tax=Rhamnusium bicolor TaxID=1586634 RepID=A0AAV8Z1S2_9CUCU|nr:hypothetical protein NQ314_006548 [Rhamnusium bicolor]
MSQRSDEDSPMPATPRSNMSSPAQDLEPFEDEGALLGDIDQGMEDEDGEELFGDNMENDYRPMPHLDRYDDRVLDEDEYDQMSIGDRLAAEEELRRKDREMGILRRDDRELFYDQSDDEEDPRHKRRMAEKAAVGEVEDIEMIESIENLEDTKGYTIKDWVIMMGPRTEIANRFKNFLRTYVNSKGHYVYKEKN